MDKDAILGFIKKNILSLSCAVVALLAIGALFYPLGDMIDTLQQSVNEKAGLYNTLAAFIKPRKLPVNSIDQAEPGPLTGFPNALTIKAGQAAVDKFKAASDETLKRLVDMNQQAHPLMLADELPAPKYEPNFFNFAKLYLLVLSTDPMVTGVPKPDAKPPVPGDPLLITNHDLNLQNDVMHGTMPPLPKDIDDAKSALWENTYKPQIQELNGTPVNLQELHDAYSVEALALPLKLNKLVARKFKVYVDQDVFKINAKILPDQKPTPEDIWYAQMQVWIQRDLAMAIADANSSSSCVLDAPVKRVITMEVQPAPMYTLQPTATATQGQPVAPAPASESAQIAPDFAVSASGRYSNAMYDVVQFKLVVDVDATKVNQFIETLSKGRMITILGENQYSLNAETEAAKNYLYGRGSVVRLELTGETLFFRDWTKPLMPDNVKVYLGLMAPAAGTAPMAPGGAPGGPGFMTSRPPMAPMPR
jgi:hypothetical protein